MAQQYIIFLFIKATKMQTLTKHSFMNLKILLLKSQTVCYLHAEATYTKVNWQQVYDIK